MKSRIVPSFLAGLLLAFTAGCGSGAPRMPLDTAAANGQITIVKQHIAAGTNLNAKNSEGQTALHLAAQKGDADIVQALVEGGADLNVKNSKGQTAQDIARRSGNAEIVALLTPQPAAQPRGRGLIDGGLGVSEAMEGF